MNIKQLLLILTLLITLCAVSVSAQVTCNSTLVSSAFLTSNLNCAGGTAIVLNNSNIYLDCAGFSITGDNTGGTSGVEFFHHNNVTVRNCNISNFTYGIRGLNSTNSTMFNNDLSFNQYGILMTQMNFTTVDKNVFLNNTIGLYLTNSQKNNIKNNNASFNSQEGMYLTASSDFNNFTSNNCSYSGQHGIHLNLIEHTTLVGNRFIQNGQRGFYASSQSHNTTLINNTAINNTDDGFRISTSQDSTVINNTAINNSFYGIYLHFQCLRGVVENNTARNNKYYGINIYGDSFNVTNNLAEGCRVHSGFQFNLGRYSIVKDNIARNNKRDGFELTSRGNHTFINNTAYGNGDYGFHLDRSEYNILINNTAYNNQKDGFYLYGASDGNNLTNNTARNNTGSGFHVYYYGADNNTFTRNKALNNSDKGFHLDRATFNNFTDNQVINNSAEGFRLAYSTDSIFTNNTVNFNSVGFLLYFSSHRNQLFNNIAKGNKGTGFSFSSVSNNIVNNNNASDNQGHGIYLSGGSASSFANNSIINNSWDGLQVRNTANNNFTDFIVNHNAKNATYAGVHLESTVSNNDFFNFSLLNNSWGIYLEKTIFGTPSGNFFSNFTINNSAISLYVLDSLNNTINDTYCPLNVVFNDSTHGMINYTQDVNFTVTTRFSDYIAFSNNMFHVNSSGAPRLNKSAILTFTGLSIAGDPQPIVDFNDTGIFSYCAPPTCYELLNNSPTTFIYNVSHFTNYSSNVTPYGNLTNASIIVPNGSITINNSNTFNVTCRVYCNGSLPCINTNVTLDPINPVNNISSVPGAMQDVYSDSEFIYGAADDTWSLIPDNATYVWNKTSLNLFTRIPDVDSVQAVHADSSYIYSGGKNNTLRIYNRSDYVTPFANLYNITLPGDIISILSDNNYIYVGTKWAGFGNPYLYIYNKTPPAFPTAFTPLDAADVVRGIDVDSSFLYVASHDCNVYIYNISNFSQPPVTLSTWPWCDVKSVSVDSNYIYATGHDWSNSFFIVWHKSNYSVATNQTLSKIIGTAVNSGGPSGSAYLGGTEWSWTNGTIIEYSKSNLSITDQYNITDWIVKALHCDSSYLYAAVMNSSFSNNNPGGKIMLFNNPCVIPPVPVTIQSFAVVPSAPQVSSSAYCSANITTPGTLHTVYFNVTYPNSTVSTLSVSNVGSIYRSANFTVGSVGPYSCTVFANNTNGTANSKSLSFYAGNKGAIPMNSGSPFFTTSQNPRYSSNQSCLNSTSPGGYCDTTWTVTANATPGTTWEFFCSYENDNGDLNSSKINVTIAGAQPSPPPPRRRAAPSGGGGGGGATRPRPYPVVQQPMPVGCFENWICGDWTDCFEGEQIRECVDLNQCGTFELRPAESRSCTAEPVEEKPAPVKAPVAEPKQLEPVKSVPAPEIQDHQIRKDTAIFISNKDIVRAAAVLIAVSALFFLVFLFKGGIRIRREPEPVDTAYLRKQKRLAKQILEGKVRP